MQFQYNLADIPPLSKLISKSIMWAIISITFVVILGNMITALYPYSPAEVTWYMQKLLFITGIATIIQTLFGHRLPAVFGPSSILIVGAAASVDFTPEAFTTAILISGLFGMFISLTGIMPFITKIFTRRVVTAILMLLPITLIPSITAMLFNTAETGTITLKIIFLTVFILTLFYANAKTEGVVKKTLILWALIGGSLAYFICFGGLGEPAGIAGSMVQPDALSFFIEPVFVPGVIISILICYLGLITNDIGAIQGIAEVVQAENGEKSLRDGMFFTGLINVISGAAGVIGGVNYSLSTGMIFDTKNAARITLIPAGLIMMGVACIPPFLIIFDAIPTLITGCLIIFLLVNLFSAALSLLFTLDIDTTYAFQTGVIIGAGILVGATITFMPDMVFTQIPVSIRPIFGNGFLIGVITVIVMEHLIYGESI